MSNAFFFDEEEIIPRRLRRSGRSWAKRSMHEENCSTCANHTKCKTPKMLPRGKGNSGVAIVLSMPTKIDDAEGKPLTGVAGSRLKSIFRKIGMRSIDEEFKVLYAIPCYSPNDNKSILSKKCANKLTKHLKEIEPTLIITVGETALNSVMGRKVSVFRTRGKLLISKIYNCFVMPVTRLESLTEDTGKIDPDDSYRVMYLDIKKALQANLSSNCTVESRTIDEIRGNIIVDDVPLAIKLLEKMSYSTVPVCFDYETNQLSPFKGEPKIILMGLSTTPKVGYSIYVPNPISQNLKDAIQSFLLSDCSKIAQNATFETMWSKVIFGIYPNNINTDTMLQEHVVDERQGTKSLNSMAFTYCGSTYKEEHGPATSIEQTASDAAYNSLDCRYPILIDRLQKAQLDPNTNRGSQLLVQAVPALARMTVKGICVSPKRLLKLKKKATESIEASKKLILQSNAAIRTENTLGKMFAFTDEDIRTMFYTVFGLKPTVLTNKTKQPAIGIEALEEAAKNADNKEAQKIIGIMKSRREWEKILSTYINPFLAMRDSKDLLHPEFLLHTTRTFRSSGKNPNMQNVPNHGKFAKDIRQCIIPKLDVFAECDYSGMEVRIIASVSGDRNLLDDLWNNVDLHRLWASRIYGKPESEITKDQRYNGKNAFVFPMFYGSSWRRMTGPPLFLKEGRARELIRMFWDRYSNVRKWQDSKKKEYTKKGYITLVSGFKRHGPISITQIGNTPVQGPAFHVLLDGIIKIHKEMLRKSYNSHMVGETHDSILFDCDLNEFNNVIKMSTQILKKTPSWLPTPVPLDVEWSFGVDWGSMEEFKIGK